MNMDCSSIELIDEVKHEQNRVTKFKVLRKILHKHIFHEESNSLVEQNF